MRYAANIILILLLCLGIVACGGAKPDMATDAGSAACLKDSKAYVERMDLLLKKWDDANEIANKTARISLAGPVSSLTAIKQDAESLAFPECAKDVNAALVNYMSKHIRIYLEFMSQQPTGVAELDAKEAMDKFIAGITALKSGKAWTP